MLFVGFAAGRTHEVPGRTEFWRVAGQPVATFGAGLCALVVGLGALFGVLEVSRRTLADAAVDRKQTAHDLELSRCWERFNWVVEQAASSKAGAAELFPAEMITNMLKGLTADARRLKDTTLEEGLYSYSCMLAAQFASVVAQQQGSAEA
jgi:hypothetical protein